jgi:hypothetical protein
MPYKNKEDQIEHTRRYNREHAEERNAYMRQYYHEHSEERKSYQLERYKEHSEERKIYSKKYYEEHKEEHRERCKQYYQKHIQKIKKCNRLYRQEHANELKIYKNQYHKNKIKDDPAHGKKHYKKYKGHYCLKAKLREKYIKQATPPWADLNRIKDIYQNCPEGYEVDHIIPLQGKFVSGLNIPINLQYLTTEENRKKGNRIL